MAKSRKSQRRSHRRTRRRMRGGQAPVNYSNPGPMRQSLAQGEDFERYHSGQHGGMSPYPASVVASTLPAELSASARINPTLQAYREIAGLKDPGQQGGRRDRKSRKGRKSRKNHKSSRNSRKNRKNRKSRKQYGGDFVRWGGGGYNLDVDTPMNIGESYKMLIPPNMVAQAGLHPEWKDAANPSSMTPK